MGANIFKKNVFLANQPFEVTSYLRAATDDLVARFSSAESGETNLDLLKVETQQSFRGGMFQRVFDDPEKVSSITNAYFNKLDERLYPTPTWTVTNSTNDMGPNGVTSWCFFSNFYYITFRSAATPQTNKLYKCDPANGAITVVTLPSALANGTDPLKLCAYGANIFISARQGQGTGVDAYRYDGNTTFTSVTGAFISFFTFNDNLYGVGSSRGLYQVTNATSTPITFSKVATFGFNTTTSQSFYHDAINFNNALYIATDDGLYRYDGTTLSLVLDYRTSIDDRNFEHLAVFNGRLYYNIGNKLFQFDGINIEMLQDFSAGYKLNYMIGSPDRLWISVTIDTGVPYSDKFVSGASTYRHSVFCYDGVGFFEYRAFTTDLIIDYTQLTLIPTKGHIYAYVPDVYFNGSGDPASHGFNYHRLDLDDEFSTTHVSDGFEVISSEIDNNYSSILKVLNGVSTNFTITNLSQADLTIAVQYLYDGDWSAWTDIWTTNQGYPDGTLGDYLLHDQGGFPTSLSTTPGIYERMRFRVTLTITTTPSILPSLSNVTLRYTLQPRLRFKWLLGLMLAGVDTRGLTTPMGSDGVLEDRSATTLRKIIYDTYRNRLPILLYDADFTIVKDGFPEDGGDCILAGTDFVVPGDTLAFQDLSNPAGAWLNKRIDTVVYDEVNDQTVITYSAFGDRIGIGAGDSSGGFGLIENGAQVRKSHAVYIKNIRNERYVLDDNTINDQAGYSDIPSEITVDVVEV